RGEVTSTRPGSEGGLTLVLGVGHDDLVSAPGAGGVGESALDCSGREFRCKVSFTPSISRDRLSKLDSSRSRMISATSLAVRVNGDLRRYSSRAIAGSQPVWQPASDLLATTPSRAGSATAELGQSGQWPTRYPAVARSSARPCARFP